MIKVREITAGIRAFTEIAPVIQIGNVVVGLPGGR